MVGSCREGLGEEVFERWMTTSANAKEMIRHIACNFELGGHKAAAIAMVLEKAADSGKPLSEPVSLCEACVAAHLGLPDTTVRERCRRACGLP